MNKNSMLDKKSRYVIGGTSEKEQLGIGWWERKEFRPSPDDQLIVITGRHVGRIDLIATDFLGDSKYWWIIAQYNAIIDPFDEIQEGKYLRIPSQSTINLLIGKLGGSPSQRELKTNLIQPIL
jgi:hypothetical protein